MRVDGTENDPIRRPTDVVPCEQGIAWADVADEQPLQVTLPNVRMQFMVNQRIIQENGPMISHGVLPPFHSVRTFAATVLVVALFVSGGVPTTAQYAFEYDYGSYSCDESGYNGVEPVTMQNGCAGGGFIAVGSTAQTQPFAACGNTDVYVVRTDPAGVRLWENRYDISGLNYNDVGYSIKEVADGFIVTGTTEEMNRVNTDVFLLKIDCNGAFQWAQVYGWGGRNDEARDVIVAANGNNLPGGTAAGDYVVAGWTYNPVNAPNGQPNRDALLLRTNNLGAPIWMVRYDGCPLDGNPRFGYDEAFHALIEGKIARPGVTVGDIVAVGYTDSYTPRRAAWAVRVNGNTGALVAPMAGIYSGVNENATFNAVCEMTVGNEAGNLAYAGWSDFYGTSDIYVVKSGPNPCTRLAERSLGDLGQGKDVANGIIERTKAFSYWGMGAIGDLFLTGLTNNGQIGTDVFLLDLAPLNLAYRGGFVYGDHGDLDDIGYSLMDDDQQPDPNSLLHGGFVICGLNTRIPQYLDPPERDLYLIKTNRQGGTGCEDPWAPDEQAEYWFQTCAMPCSYDDPEWYPAGLTTTTEVDWPHLLCQSILLRINTGSQEEAESEIANAVRTYPNPVVSGKPFNLEVMSDGEGSIRVSVVTLTGESIYATDIPSTTEPLSVSIPTQGWATGTYLIRVEQNGVSRVLRLIVMD